MRHLATRIFAGLALLAIAGLTPVFAQAQSATSDGRRPIPYPVVPSNGFEQAIKKGTRTRTGEPGPNYWQQWTDYRIHARLLPEEKRIEGRAWIVYHNRSPDDLRILALQLAQNVHAEGAQRTRSMEVTGGVELSRVAVAGEEAPLVSRPGPTLGYLEQGTTLGIVLPEPLGTGASAEIAIDWSFDVPQRGASGRMGWNSDNLFHIAYWYPQMAVYDDIVAFAPGFGLSGWQVDQFTGTAEFYAGFGSYDLTVEAPPGWVIMATGELTNAEEVLPTDILERYRRAHRSDSVVHVLTEADFGPGKATKNSDTGYLSWHFESDRVRDVAFSAFRESNWDAARTPVGDRDGDGARDYALVNTFWRSNYAKWSEAWRYAQHSIDFLSRWTGFSYPWPHMTAVEGAGIMGGGMEFPMMTLIGGFSQAPETALYSVTAHELGHMWVPMIVSNDERRHAWMDEGTTSFNTTQAQNEFYPNESHEAGDQRGYLRMAQLSLEGEIMRLSDHHDHGAAYGTASYAKPATVLVTLRELLGKDTFEKGFQTFIRNWAYKHPQPWDLFNTFNTVSGQNLDWFWRTWYYETWTLDQAVASVTADRDGTTIVIDDNGWAPMPTRVTITRESGETVMKEVPVDTWLAGKTSATIKVGSGSPVVRVEIDASGSFPDADRSNNVWEKGE